MTTTAGPPAGTQITKYEDVEVGHWFRANLGGAYALISQPVEVMALEWYQAANGVIITVRTQDGKTRETPFAAWRRAVRPCLPPWAE
jgi:hypothetical protein